MIDSENETGNIVTYEDDDNEEYGIEIKGKNVVKLNADKVLVKTPLLTSAQDIAGAINELFQGGSGSETSADSDYEKWLSLPEPASNQAVFLVRAVNGYMVYALNTDVPYEYIKQTVGYTIDWGDDTVETLANDNLRPTHTYEKSGEYVITFTNVCGDNTYASIATTGSFWIMAKYGDNVYADRVVGGKINYNVSFHAYLRYIRLAHDTKFNDAFFSGCFALREIEWDGIINDLYNSMFYQCRSLNWDNLNFGSINHIPDSCFRNCTGLKKIPTNLTQCLTIGDSAFYLTSLTNVSLDNCTSIGNAAFAMCQALKNLKAQNCISIEQFAFQYNYALNTAMINNCTSIGDTAFIHCYSLANLTISEDCTFGTNCFQNCYALYPKPDGSI